MNEVEAGKIIDAIKAGKTYFKPLPFYDVEGGTTITYDENKKVFKEHYLNRSVYGRGTEEYNKNRSEEEMLQMLIEEDYTDRNYIIRPKADNTHELRD